MNQKTKFASRAADGIRRFSLLVLCVFAFGASMYAQTSRTVSGTVLDANNEPLIGVAVFIEGTTNGASTDLDGKWSLSGVTNSTKLTFSTIGYKTVTEEVGTRSVIDVVLSEDVNYLDEVVVVGYGTMSRKHIISSVSTVSNEAISDRPVANIQQALQGAAANLIIQTTNFDPTNSGMNLSIRGISTMGNNSPLVVIDGVPQADAGRMNDLNPSDIEAISVLKDAGSAAIYGARSSNGVILIQTKSGKKEQAPQVQFSAQVGAQDPDILFDPVPSYLNSILRNEALTNVGRAPQFTSAEIQDMYVNGDCVPFVEQAMKTALQQNYNLSVSGGSKSIKYMVSAGYFDQNSNYIGPDYGKQRYNVRSNISAEYGRFKVTANVGYSREEIKQPTTSGFLFANLARFPTYYFFRTKDENGIYYTNNYKYGGCGAVLAQLESGGYNKYDNEYLTGTFTGEFEIIKGLKLRGVLSAESRYQHRFSDHMTYLVGADNGTNWSDPADAIVSGSTDTPADDWIYKSSYLNAQVLLDFNREFGKHSVSGLLGWSQESNKGYGVSISKDYLNDLNQPTDNTVIGTGSRLSSQDNYKNALMSYFGRASYSYDEKYYVELTARYDMSSKFLKVRNAGFFPAVSVGWRLSNEEFMGGYASNVGDLKLRASYGLNGNQQDVGNYDFLTTYGTWLNAYGFNGSPVSGLMFTMGNEWLTWETANTFNVGADASFFKNSLNVSFDYFYKRTHNILLSPILPSNFGASVAKENRGVLDNQGWELTIDYNLNRGGAWNHHFNFNIADSQNKVVEYGTPKIHSNDGVTVIIQEGLPLNSYYGYKVAGYFQNYEQIQAAALPNGISRDQLRPGDVQYVDLNEDGVINDEDRAYLGYGFPRYTFGFTYSLDWKGIDFSIMLQGVLKRTNAIRGELFEPFHSDYGNTMYMHQLDYWTPDNTDALWPRLAASGSPSISNNFGRAGSELNMLPGAYMRVKNIQIGYTFPSKWTKKFACQSLRIYFDAQNPLTFSKFNFIDPETTEFGSNMGRGGANSVRNYPTLRYFGGGVNITF